MVLLLAAAAMFTFGAFVREFSLILWPLAGVVSVVALLPASAHRAFRRGQFRRARWLYGAVGALAVSKNKRLRAQGSQAAALLALDRPSRGLAVLRRVRERSKDPSTIATCWGNEAQVNLVAGETSIALEQIEKALAIRPNCPAFLHTLALIRRRQGRLRDALRILHSPALLLSQLPPHTQRIYLNDTAEMWRSHGEHGFAEACLAQRELLK